MPESERGTAHANIGVSPIDLNRSQESQIARDYAAAPMTAVNNKRHSYATAVATRSRFRTIDQTSPSERAQYLAYQKKNVSRGRQQNPTVR